MARKTESAASDVPIDTNLMRVGIPYTYNMKCYRMAFPPPTAEEFAVMGKEYGIPCGLHMLMWVHNENAEFSQYDPSGLKSNPERGQPGIQPECFVFRDKDLFDPAGPNGMSTVFSYIKDRFEGAYANQGFGAPPSVLSSGLELNDFFESRHNDKVLGLLTAEFVPQRLRYLPKNMPEMVRNQIDYSLRTDSDAFDTYINNKEVPCVKISHIESQLPDCIAEPDEPVPLDEGHCDDAYFQALNDVTDYAQTIDARPLKDTQYRWPKPPMYCVWDCGNYWDGYDSPVHSGLSKATVSDFKEKLAGERAYCKQLVAGKKHCLLKPNSSSVASAIEQANRGGFMQEVCGDYVDETLRSFIVNKDAAWGLLLLAIIAAPATAGASLAAALATVTVVTATVGSAATMVGGGVAKEVAESTAVNMGINWHFNSTFSDETARHVTQWSYRCEIINVRSTGNPVVDRVRETLSYNDIKVMNTPHLLSKQDPAKVKQFNDKLFEKITKDVTNIYTDQCNVFTDRCIWAKRNPGQSQRSKRIDQTFINRKQPPGEQCLTLAVPAGRMNCKFWMNEGLAEDAFAARQLDRQFIPSAVRRVNADWSVDASIIPDPKLPHTKDYDQVCAMLAAPVCTFEIGVCLTFSGAGCIHHMGALHEGIVGLTLAVRTMGSPSAPQVLPGMYCIREYVQTFCVFLTV